MDKKQQAEIEKINFREENCKILIEILKYFGKDVNIVELFYAFKKIYEKHFDIVYNEKANQSNMS